MEQNEETIVRTDALQLSLNPSAMDGAAAVIRDIASVDAPSKELVTFVLDRAEGVPLFLEELTRSALELGLPADPQSTQGHSGEDEIPSSLQYSLLARLDRIGPAKIGRAHV